MLIGGIHTLTLLDYPGKVASIIFTVGCNFRCGYCHNAEFVLPEKIEQMKKAFIPEEKIFNFLETRKGFLDGVVVSGGEPTIHSDLLSFVRKIKNMGFLVKLDTNGTNPEVLKKMLAEKLLDYIAMDIKASSDKYDDITGVKNDFLNIKKSRNLILQSGIDYEFRTTIVKGFHNEEEIKKIGQFCRGAKRYTLQNFRNIKVLDEKFSRKIGFTKQELDNFKKIAEKYVEKVVVFE
jgi:pyruvate formate lyase activating enzyme